MSDCEEWGPWIEHDGEHIPPNGATVRATFDDLMTLTGVIDHADETHINAFMWRGTADVSHVIRYRIRKPRALIQLREMIETLPAPRQKEVVHD